MRKIKIKESVSSFFLLTFLFFPNIFFHHMFTYGILFLTLILLFDVVRLNTSRYILIAVTILFFLSMVIIRFPLFKESGIRDVIEIGRIVFFILALCIITCMNINIEKVKRISIFYIVCDFLISLSQFLDFKAPYIDYIQRLYSSEHQIEGSLNASHRVLGLSSDPSAHGLMILLLITFLLVYYIQFEKTNHIGLLCCVLMGFFTILVSQSQTAFIGAVLLISLSMIYFLYKGNNSRNYKTFLTTTGILITCVVLYLINQLHYLITLFSHGLERSSYVGREYKRGMFFDMALENPLGFLIGYGKDFFGQNSAAMDNEYVYILLVYGVPVYILFMGMLMYFCYKFVITENRRLQLFAFPLVLGIPLAWPSAYYLVPKIMLFLIVLYAFYRNQHT